MSIWKVSMIIMCGNNAPSVGVNLGSCPIARFRVLKRVPRAVPVEFSESALRDRQDLLDACMLPPIGALMVHAVFSNSVVRRGLPLFHAHMFLVLRMRIFAPAPCKIHMALADRLPPRLDGV